MKRIDEGKAIQHFTPRRKRSNWCEQNLERCRRLVRLGEMTPAGLAVAPDLDPAKFVFEDWVIAAIKADQQAWKNYLSSPENYRRIKVDRIQHYQHTDRSEYAQRTLRNFIRDCHDGKMQGGGRGSHHGHVLRPGGGGLPADQFCLPPRAINGRNQTPGTSDGGGIKEIYG